MWEKPRQDGKKKLKTQAVPTIFPVYEKELPGIPAGYLDGLKPKLRNNEGYDENSEESTSVVTNHFQAVTNIDEEHLDEAS